MNLLDVLESSMRNEEYETTEGKLYLEKCNYLYHQGDEQTSQFLDEYDDWEGNEENRGDIYDEDYERFTWIVDEGEEVSENQHLAVIKTKPEDDYNGYCVVLISNTDGIIHKEIKNGKHPMDSGEYVATIYEDRKAYEREVILSGKVKAKDTRVRKCPGCGTLLDSNKKYCGECGKKLILEDRVCTSCGEKISEGQKFCYECGTKVE